MYMDKFQGENNKEDNQTNFALFGRNLLQCTNTMKRRFNK